MNIAHPGLFMTNKIRNFKEVDIYFKNVDQVDVKTIEGRGKVNAVII